MPNEPQIECTDYDGRRVALTRRTVVHVEGRHLEMVRFLNRTCDVLGAPNLVCYRKRTDSHLYYKLGVLTGKLSNTYMVVVVRYNQTRGASQNAVWTTRPADDELRVPFQQEVNNDPDHS